MYKCFEMANLEYSKSKLFLPDLKYFLRLQYPAISPKLLCFITQLLNWMKIIPTSFQTGKLLNSVSVILYQTNRLWAGTHRAGRPRRCATDTGAVRRRAANAAGRVRDLPVRPNAIDRDHRPRRTDAIVRDRRPQHTDAIVRDRRPQRTDAIVRDRRPQHIDATVRDRPWRIGMNVKTVRTLSTKLPHTYII